MIWTKSGAINRTLAKGTKTSTLIWYLHANAHDFDVQIGSAALVTRKMFSSNLAHISLVCIWLAGMYFHGTYTSNYLCWLKNPADSVPSAHTVWDIVGQDLLNGDAGTYYQGMYITSGLFELWLGQGIVTVMHLKYATIACFVSAIISATGSYFHMHISYLQLSLYNKYQAIAVHHQSILLGFGSISWSGHIIHIAQPLNWLLQANISSIDVFDTLHLLSVTSVRDGIIIFDHTARIAPLIKSIGLLLDELTGSFSLALVRIHHLYVGIVFIIGGTASIYFHPKIETNSILDAYSWHSNLSINLSITGTISIVYAHIAYTFSPYPYARIDYSMINSLYIHHMWVGAILTIGGGAHGTIYTIRDLHCTTGINNT